MGHYELSISQYLLASYVFVITVLFYSVAICKQRKETFQKFKKDIFLVTKINFSTAVAWLALIYALKYIEPAIALSIGFAALTISTMLISHFHKETTKPTAIDFLLSMMLFTLITILCVHLIHKNETSHALTSKKLLLGISFCLISGISSAFNTIHAECLSRRDFTSIQILAIRFYLTLFIAFIILYTMHQRMIPNAHEAWPIVLLSFTSTIIPMYFAQKGITLTNAIAVALVTPILPAMTFFMELLDPRIKFSSFVFTISLLISITILFGAVHKIQKHAKMVA